MAPEGSRARSIRLAAFVAGALLLMFLVPASAAPLPNLDPVEIRNDNGWAVVYFPDRPPDGSGITTMRSDSSGGMALSSSLEITVDSGPLTVWEAAQFRREFIERMTTK